jgi:hypothetical protein
VLGVFGFVCNYNNIGAKNAVTLQSVENNI